MPKDLTDLQLLTELQPVVEENINRHMKMAREWNPHDYIPWSDGKNYYALGGQDWDPDQAKLSEVARVAMVQNLLTEDNLPSYHREIAMNFSMDDPWGFWVNRWTAEENRHGIALRDYLVVTRAVDPVELEITRMEQVTRGFSPGQNHQGDLFAESLFDAVMYVSFQELATRVSHRNTGKACNDPVADALLGKISNDENLHMIFYRNMTASAVDLAPDQTLDAIAAGKHVYCEGPLAHTVEDAKATLWGIRVSAVGQLTRAMVVVAGSCWMFSVRLSAGSKVIVQMHYNTLTAGPLPDRTEIDLKLDAAVEQEATVQPFTNPTWVDTDLMMIPAMQEDVAHSFAADPTQLFGGAAIEIHDVGMHLHTLGKSARMSIERADGSETCLLDIPRWDFHWQGNYRLAQPVTLSPGDRLKVECRWDNSPPNQPIIDGKPKVPADVTWGEGTNDEMCLGTFYTNPL